MAGLSSHTNVVGKFVPTNNIGDVLRSLKFQKQNLNELNMVGDGNLLSC
jgi:hypothetical protein